MKARHHCTVHWCEDHGYWECMCDGIQNCHWLDFHESTWQAAIDAVMQHEKEMYFARQG